MYGNRYEDDNGKHSIAKIICYKKFDAIPTSILWIFNFDKKKIWTSRYTPSMHSKTTEICYHELYTLS